MIHLGGDYGDLLINGECTFELVGRDNAPREFRGTSPMADVLFSSKFILVQKKIKNLLEEQFSSLTFCPVYEELIVSIPWNM